MNQPRSVLVLHEPGAPPAALVAVVQALSAQGTRVELRPCGEPYAEVLLAIANADTVLFWR